MPGRLARGRRFLARLAVLVVLAGCAAPADPIEVPAATTALGPSPTLPGSLTLPAGAGPFPIVVLLHGCMGLQLETAHRGNWNRHQQYARWYAARGFAALILDSFTSRGVTSVCRGEPWPTMRALDVYRAVEHLARRGIVDPGRAVVQGLSHGGSAALAAMDEQVAELGATAVRLRGGVAYYPGCAESMARAYYAPVLILIGDEDDWTPSAPCEQLLALEQKRGPGRVRLVVYPGATHSFDFIAPRRWNEYGKLLAFDAAATRDAERRVEAFLAEVIGRLR
jgi:dienelactone hydrolase